MRFLRQVWWWELTLLLCLLHQSCVLGGGASALPLGGWAAGVEKASSHRHWEHIVRRSSYYARYNSDNVVDDTAHIVNVQEYYQSIFNQGWDNYRDNERELFNMLNTLESVVAQGYGGRDTLENRVTSQDLRHAMELGTHTKPIPGRYIVMFQEGTDDYTLDRTMAIMSKANRDSNRKVRASDMSVLRYAGKGFTATLNSRAVELMTKHPALAHIEEDTALRRSEAMIRDDEAVEADAVPWNLDRLDQRERVLDQSFDPSGDGQDVDIYIIDTGVRDTHEELKGRVKYAGFDAVDALTGTHNNGRDCNGHGTHCAGTAAGTTYGVAKKATIYNLRALNCEGTGAVSGIVKGIDKIIETKIQGGNGGRPIVISQSLGVKKSVSLNTAIRQATDHGIVAVGAAGNQGGYSCDYSPASAQVGIAVGASDKRDSVAIFSNYGECTDIQAPGSQITSASHLCDTCTKTMSGTSMAAPHAAGYAAIVMSQNPQLSAKQVKEKMISQSTKGKVTMSSIASAMSSHPTPNRLLYVESVAAARANGDSIASIQGFGSRP